MKRLLPDGTIAERKKNALYIDGKKLTKLEFKKAIYNAYGIQYKLTGKNGDTEYIYCEPLKDWIKPVLKNGNTKIGNGVWNFSINAGMNAIDTHIIMEVIKNVVADVLQKMKLENLRHTCGGTCHCSCDGCYAQEGHYKHDNVKICLTRHTYLVMHAVGWLFKAIQAQEIADSIEMLRIHVAGDFENARYASYWLNNIQENKQIKYWTYTKQYGRGFDEILNAIDAQENANIVKSLVTVNGKTVVNFGKCRDLINLYNALQAAGENVWLCSCGLQDLIDKKAGTYKARKDRTRAEKAREIHCNKCNHCFSAKYVLFLLHGVKDYDPLNDPDFDEYAELVLNQSED